MRIPFQEDDNFCTLLSMTGSAFLKGEENTGESGLE
jgi:hypothetical protein